MNLEERIRHLARELLPLAVETLREAIRIPADWVDRPDSEGGDSFCGTSNHEAPRLEYLRDQILELNAVERPEDVGFDEFGNLWWRVEDSHDGVDPADKKVVYLDGHVDTVAAMRSSWVDVLGEGVDAYNGMIDPEQVDADALDNQLGSPPRREDWQHMVWGRGSADQLAGVVCQILATRILLELRDSGSLTGVRVCCFATVAEEDNDGGGTMYYMGKALASGAAENIPDVLILTEPTGSAELGSLGIYRGQRGRMQIEVEVVGKSSHGSMPWEGLNPLEYGATIIAEAAAAHERGEGFAVDEFLGPGSRTASMSTLQTPSDCAVPDSFTVRFDRRLTAGEDPQSALDDVESLPGVAAAREAGLRVEVRAPQYRERTWRGYTPDNAQIYPGWQTPEDHPAILAAAATYRAVVAPMVEEKPLELAIGLEPRIGRWVFSTDGVGAPVPAEIGTAVSTSKNWVTEGRLIHPAIFGIGPGIEENTHKIGESVDSREMALVMAFYACYPATLRRLGSEEQGAD